MDVGRVLGAGDEFGYSHHTDIGRIGRKATSSPST
jgi:hypothetical protein